MILALFSFYYLRGDTDYSLITIYWILFSTFLSDTGGDIFGKMFKGKKLTKISPNKTYSGSIGSIFLSLTSIPFIHLTQLILFKENLINFLNIKFLCLTISISVSYIFIAPNNLFLKLSFGFDNFILSRN